MEQYYYSPSTGQTYSPYQMEALFGIPVDTYSVESINNLGFYPVVATSPDFDTLLYDASSSWSIIPITGGEGAERVWTATAKPLPEAIANGSTELKVAANGELDTLLCDCGINNDVVTAAASQDPMVRPVRYQDVLDEMTTITDGLDANLTLVENATTVDEISCVVHGASGIMVTGRGGASEDDMQPSYFTDLQGLPPGVGEPELEIYIPGTDTVIPYNASLPAPYKFDSLGECYNTGDYRTTIRVAATGQVLSTVYPEEGPAVPVVWTYNPTIPSLGGGSSSHSA